MAIEDVDGSGLLDAGMSMEETVTKDIRGFNKRKSLFVNTTESCTLLVKQ